MNVLQPDQVQHEPQIVLNNDDQNYDQHLLLNIPIQIMDPHPTLRKVMSTSECAYRSMITTQLARLLDIDSEFNFDHNHNNDNDNHSINDNQRSATGK